MGGSDTPIIVGKWGVGVPARVHDSEAIPAHYFPEIFQPEFLKKFPEPAEFF